MKNKKQLPAIVVIAIISLITTIVWVGFEVYRAFSQKPSPTVTDEVIQTLDPTLDVEILEAVSRRVYLEDSEIGDTLLEGPAALLNNQAIDIQEIIEQLPEATNSGEEATSSGQT